MPSPNMLFSRKRLASSVDDSSDSLLSSSQPAHLSHINNHAVDSSNPTFKRTRRNSSTSSSSTSTSTPSAAVHINSRSFFSNHPLFSSTSTSIDSNSSLESNRSLNTCLAILDRNQLIYIIRHLIALVPNEVQSTLPNIIPKPSVQAVIKHLHLLLKNLGEAFPYSANGPSFNDYEYSRVSPVINEIQTTIIDFLDYFCSFLQCDYSNADNDNNDIDSSQLNHLQIIIEYLHAASMVTSRLPDWSTAANNQAKRDLVHRLGYAWKMALAESMNWASSCKRVVPEGLIEHWSMRLNESNTAVRNEFKDAVRDFTIYLAWLTNDTLVQPVDQASSLFPSASGYSSKHRLAMSTCSAAMSSPAAINHNTAPGIPPSVIFGASSPALLQVLNAPSSSTSVQLPNLPHSVPSRVAFGMGH